MCDFWAGAPASDVGVAAVVYEYFSLCSLGCGCLGRAALWLVYEQWYVGTTVPEGGMCASRLCIVWAIAVVWCNSSGGSTSSSLERPMFAPPIAFTVFSLWLWAEVVSS
jgi:hypothetical protein